MAVAKRREPEDYLDFMQVEALAYIEDYLQAHYEDQALILAETTPRDESAVLAGQTRLSFAYSLLSRIKALIVKKTKAQTSKAR